jgi:hypothetical protein
MRDFEFTPDLLIRAVALCGALYRNYQRRFSGIRREGGMEWRDADGLTGGRNREWVMPDPGRQGGAAGRILGGN